MLRYWLMGGGRWKNRGLNMMRAVLGPGRGGSDVGRQVRTVALTAFIVHLLYEYTTRTIW